MALAILKRLINLQYRVKNIKYRCKICDQIVDIKEGESCPICCAKFEILEFIQESLTEEKLTWSCKHDAVHEMAKDEQRHGAALEATLKRYF